jgi:hypothetical protein
MLCTKPTDKLLCNSGAVLQTFYSVTIKKIQLPPQNQSLQPTYVIKEIGNLDISRTVLDIVRP